MLSAHLYLRYYLSAIASNVNQLSTDHTHCQKRSSREDVGLGMGKLMFDQGKVWNHSTWFMSSPVIYRMELNVSGYQKYNY